MENTATETKPKKAPKKRLLGVREAAEYLGISIWSMRARIWAGDVPFVQFPNCRRQLLDVRDLEEMIRNNKIITDY